MDIPTKSQLIEKSVQIKQSLPNPKTPHNVLEPVLKIAPPKIRNPYKLLRKIENFAPIHKIKSILDTCKSDEDRLICNEKNHNAVFLASIYNRLDVIKMLLTEFQSTYKNVLNLTDKDGFTALTWACYHGHTEIITFLLSKGSSAFIPDNHGNSMLDYVLQSREKLAIDTLNAWLKQNTEPQHFKQYREDCKLIKWMGHGLGLNQQICIQNVQNKAVLVAPYGSRIFKHELNFFLHLLENYIGSNLQQPSNLKQYFDLFIKAVKNTLEYLQFQNKITAETLKEQLKTDLTIIPAASSSHGIGLILYKDWGILCDRGEGKLESGTTIFKIQNKSNITAAYIESLYAKHDSEESTEELYKKLIDDTSGIFSTNQVFMLYLLKYESLKSTLLSKENADSTSKDALEALSLEAKNYAHKHYKIFSTWSRDYLVDYLCVRAKLAYTAPNPSVSNPQLYFKLAKTIIAEHHGQERLMLLYNRKLKQQQELKRATKICLTLYSLDKLKSKQMVAHLKAQKIKADELFLILDPDLKQPNKVLTLQNNKKTTAVFKL